MHEKEIELSENIIKFFAKLISIEKQPSIYRWKIENFWMKSK